MHTEALDAECSGARMCVEMCIYMCMGILMDLRMDMCTDMCMDMRIDMYMGMRMGISWTRSQTCAQCLDASHTEALDAECMGVCRIPGEPEQRQQVFRLVVCV